MPSLQTHLLAEEATFFSEKLLLLPREAATAF